MYIIKGKIEMCEVERGKGLKVSGVYLTHC